MIEKLDKKMEFVEISIIGKEKAECLDFEAGRKFNSKINELVDAVNKLQLAKDVMFNRIDILNNAICEMRNAAENGTISKIEKVEPAENVQVDEIEQAEKWIGKLCWFSQLYGCHQHIAILKRISESGLYVTDDGELYYAYCEPVKPDDDIIYKGGDND